MPKYQILYTVDQSGARCTVTEGWLDRETDNLMAAIIRAEELTRAGQCGYVRRSDGAILTPDGQWSKETP